MERWVALASTSPSRTARRLGVGNLRAFRKRSFGFLSELHESAALPSFWLGRQRVFVVGAHEHVHTVLLDEEHFRHEPYVRPRWLTRWRERPRPGIASQDRDTHRRARRELRPILSDDAIASCAAAAASEAGRRASSFAPDAPRSLTGDAQAIALHALVRGLVARDFEGDLTELGAALHVLFRSPFRSATGLPFETARGIAAAQRVKQELARLSAATSEPGPLALPLRESTSSLDAARLHSDPAGNALVLFVGGYEASAWALIAALHLLAEHPEAQRAVRAEARLALEEAGTAGLVAERLPYTVCALKETLRLWPPTWYVGRRVFSDCRLADVALRRGDYLLVCFQLLHRDAAVFAEPERFDPGRWDDGAERALPKFGYIPFGTGGRRCLGEYVAWPELLAAVGALVARWHYVPAGGHSRLLTGGRTIWQGDGLWLTPTVEAATPPRRAAPVSR